VPALPCRQEAEETDTDEALGQGMKQESVKELIGRERHRARGTVAFVVFPAEGDLAVGDIQEPVVGDSHAMRVTSEIVKDMLRATEGTLRVDDPVDVVEGSDKGAESFRVIEQREITEEP